MNISRGKTWNSKERRKQAIQFARIEDGFFNIIGGVRVSTSTDMTASQLDANAVWINRHGAIGVESDRLGVKEYSFGIAYAREDLLECCTFNKNTDSLVH